MLAFENILQRIESEISQLQFTNPPKSLYEPIEYILSLGGKRIRPALTLMACNIYNNSIENALDQLKCLVAIFTSFLFIILLLEALKLY